jgi:hypothetical protein
MPLEIKQINGRFPLYMSLVPLFNLMKTFSTSYSSSSEKSLLLKCSFLFPFCFELLDALKVSYFIYGFSCSVLISYAVNIPCSLFVLIESRSSLSSSDDILG